MTMEQQVREAVARGWWHETTKHKVLDPVLADAIVAEVVKSFTPARDPGHGHGTND